MIRAGDTGASAADGGLTLGAMEEALLASSDITALTTGNWQVKAPLAKLFELQKADRTRRGKAGTSFGIIDSSIRCEGCGYHQS